MVQFLKSESMDRAERTELAFKVSPENEYYFRLVELLQGDLNFHDKVSLYSSHNYHSFPAKFPPQIPNVFINRLTKPGDLILDPMNGSGTTTLEAYLLGRCGIGIDIDPLALRMASVKPMTLDPNELYIMGKRIVNNSRLDYVHNRKKIEAKLSTMWDKETKEFVDYWFEYETQLALKSLIDEIKKIHETDIKRFFEVAFSATIITKTGGVSLALDLAHTRPHKAKIIFDKTGKLIHGELIEDIKQHQIKKLRSPFEEFSKKVANNIKGLVNKETASLKPLLLYGDAQKIPLKDNCVDLIVTSPPYASNAIDYMRAHKFSLVWFGYSINQLGEKRSKYVGAEAINLLNFEHLPEYTEMILSKISSIDMKKGEVLYRYYSEMSRVLKEMYRVLKPGKAAVLVIGNTVMRGIDTQTQNCLANIGENIGFFIPAIGIRQLDRNRRMLPAGRKIEDGSQIQQRMHVEYVIGFLKPKDGD